VQAQIQEWLRGRDGNWYWYNKGDPGPVNNSCVGDGNVFGNNSQAKYVCGYSAYAHYFRVVAFGGIVDGTAGYADGTPIQANCV
jgi:hypothetical protein